MDVLSECIAFQVSICQFMSDDWTSGQTWTDKWTFIWNVRGTEEIPDISPDVRPDV